MLKNKTTHFQSSDLLLQANISFNIDMKLYIILYITLNCLFERFIDML